MINRGVLCSGILLSAVLANADEAFKIRRQFIEFFTRQSVNESTVKRDMMNLREGGTWADIDYASTRRGAWPTRNHLRRLESMAVAYSDPDSGLFRAGELKAALLKGLEHWADQDYRNPNWWYGRIGIPQHLAKIMILLGEDLPDNLLEDLRPILYRSKMGMTGQNKVWCAGIALMTGLLYDDPELMDRGVEAIWSELKVSTDEGVQPDWSFHQHGPQQQFGNYGLAFGGDMVKWGTILLGTRYALIGEKLEILRNYQLEGPSWIIWNGRMDMSGCGRQIDDGCQPRKARMLHRQLNAMITIDPEYREQYELRLAKTNMLIGFKPFWRSEMGIQRRPEWYASVKMSSLRVIGAETCNSENMLGLHQGDGTLLIYKTGGEYEDIVPLWDWRRLPGTTCDQGLDKLTPKGASNGFGGGHFAGVLGQGETGMAAMIYKRDALEARKAWFFEKDSVTCLGAGIEGETKGAVYTSIQQSWLKGPVTASAGKMLTHGIHSLDAGAWVHHSGFGYHLLDETICTIRKVEGNWQAVFPSRGDRPASGDTFSLWVDHGVSPNAKTYAYTVYPQTDASQMKAIVNAHPIKVLCNTEGLQAVEGEDYVQAVFYKRGQLKLRGGNVLAVDAPCLLSVRRNGKVRVSDPSLSRSTLKVKIGRSEKIVKLPAGENAGQQVLVQ